jgi:acetyl-CoA carboxylase biotin carboxyl carrier protein
MEFKEIQDILKLVSRTDLTEVEIEQKDFKIIIRRKAPESNVIYTTQQAPPTLAQPVAPTPPPAALAAPAPPVAAATPPPAKEEAASDGESKGELYAFKSPMIGTFYRSSSPETESYAKVGDYVQKGQVLCIIEAMKLFNEIESEVDGKIVKIALEDAQPVEYDQLLFLIDTSA